MKEDLMSALVIVRKLAVGFAVISIIGALTIYLWNQVYQEWEEAVAKIREPFVEQCKNLNPKYGEKFVVKSGFYEGTKIEALEMSEEEVGVKTLLNGKEVEFSCDELTRSI